MIERENMDLTAPLVRHIIEREMAAYDETRWSLQGFGMLRLYVSKSIRLHIWDPRIAVPDVTTRHTHPWDFKSTVVSGRIVDKVYRMAQGYPLTPTHMAAEIVCGTGGGMTPSAPTPVTLEQAGAAIIETGYSYRRFGNEIHESLPDPGTVTLVERRFHEDTEHAYVFYPFGREWVSAEPRQATAAEVDGILAQALARWKS